MDKLAIVVAACLTVANCGTTTGTTPPPGSTPPPPPSTPPPPPTPVLAGYADGVKTVYDSGLIFISRAKIFHGDLGTPVDFRDYFFDYRATSDPNTIIAVVEDKEIQLTYDPATNSYSGSNSDYDVSATNIAISASGQVMMRTALHFNQSKFEYFGGVFVSGLETDPNSVAAVTGTATYTGSTSIAILHDRNGSVKNASGTGTGTLNVNFDTSTVSGDMSFTDNGNSDAGYAITSSTIDINPTTISGNGFTSDLNVYGPRLVMPSINSTSVTGKFYGANASDIGITFSGTGATPGSTTGAFFLGGFIGER